MTIVSAKSGQPLHMRVEYRLYQKPPRLVYDGPLSAFDPEMELPPAESGKGDGT